MGKIRFSISVDKKLLEEFDGKIKNYGGDNRSKVIAELINKYIVEKKSIEGEYITGAISIVYNHHQRLIGEKLTDIQHSFHDIIVSSQHIHLNHDICFEIIVVKGKARKIDKLYLRLKQVKGVLNSYITIAASES